MDKGVRLRFVLELREAIEKIRGWEEGNLTMKTFNVGQLPTHESDPTVAECLLAADDEDLFSLAQYLGVEAPIEKDEVLPPAREIDPYNELVAAETALREVVRTGIGDQWTSDFTADKLAALEAKRTEEDKRRDGVAVSQDLLDYTEAYHLQTLILKHWDAVQPILQDKKRTETHLKTMLSIRNTIAHARPVAPFERHLLAGVAGQIQNLLSLYRSSSNGPDAFYASINYVRDSFGEQITDNNDRQATIPRVSVGQTISFECSATDPKSRELTWTFSLQSDHYPRIPVELGTAFGANTTFEWKVSEDHVGENQRLTAFVRNSSKYQRNGGSDASVTFLYRVNPPI